MPSISDPLEGNFVSKSHSSKSTKSNIKRVVIIYLTLRLLSNKNAQYVQPVLCPQFTKTQWILGNEFIADSGTNVGGNQANSSALKGFRSPGFDPINFLTKIYHFPKSITPLSESKTIPLGIHTPIRKMTELIKGTA